MLQYAALARGTAPVADRLGQDLLFFCAQARVPVPPPAPLPLLTTVRRAWGLGRGDPVDYEQRRFGRFDHGYSNTVFHAAARVKEFQFGHHFGRQAFAQAVQLNQGGVTDQIRNTVCNIHVSLRRNRLSYSRTK